MILFLFGLISEGNAEFSSSNVGVAIVSLIKLTLAVDILGARVTLTDAIAMKTLPQYFSSYE